MADEHIRPADPRPAGTPPTSDGILPGPPTGGRRAPLFLPNAKAAKPAGEPKDSIREIVETVVFVIVLVLMLKTFVAEAFVIPTGSMATTLRGYHKNVTCPACNFNFPVNISDEVDPPTGQRRQITGCTCPRCRLHISFDLKSKQTGFFP
jgi:hypothetical protein